MLGGALVKGKPTSDRVRLVIVLDRELWKKLKYLSVDEEKPVCEIVREAIIEKLEKLGRH
jgi:hypothetical protein